jgi:hypothetical protein
MTDHVASHVDLLLWQQQVLAYQTTDTVVPIWMATYLDEIPDVVAWWLVESLTWPHDDRYR